MPPPVNCEFSEHPNHPHRLAEAVKVFFQTLEGEQGLARQLVRDVRPLHLNLFRELTYPLYREFAGNFRGSNFKSLRNYRGNFSGAAWTPPQRVAPEMEDWSKACSGWLDEIDQALGMQETNSEETLRTVVDLVARATWNLLRIHPFADGNGHVARCLYAALFRYAGHRVDPARVHPRPEDAAYTYVFRKASSGDFAPLTRWLENQILQPTE